MCRVTQCSNCLRKTERLYERQKKYGHTEAFYQYERDLPPDPPYYLRGLEGACPGEGRTVLYCQPMHFPSFRIVVPHRSADPVEFDTYCDSIARNAFGDELDLYPLGIFKLFGSCSRATTLRRIGRLTGYHGRAVQSAIDTTIENNTSRQHTIWNVASCGVVANVVVVEREFCPRSQWVRARETPLHPDTPSPPSNQNRQTSQEDIAVMNASVHPDAILLPLQEYLPMTAVLSPVVNGSAARPIHVTGRAILVRTRDGRPVLWIHYPRTIDTAV